MKGAEQIRSLRRSGKYEETAALAASLAALSPADAELQFEATCVHDYLGREAEAVSYYLAALSGSLPAEQLRRAYVGLGGPYRALGRQGGPGRRGISATRVSRCAGCASRSPRAQCRSR